MQKDLQLLVKKNKLFTSIRLSEAFPQGIRGSIFNLEVGEVLFKQNDSGKIIYLLLLGEINLIAKENRKTDYKDLHPGDFFSNYKIVDEPFQYTTAVALKDSRLLGIYKEDFDEILSSNSDIKKNIKKYFNGEFDEPEVTEPEKKSETKKKEEKKQSAKPRYEIINALDPDFGENEQEREILNKEEELNKIQNMLDTKIAGLKEGYKSEKKSRFQKVETGKEKEEFLKREAAVNEFSRVIKKKEIELEKKQKVLKEKAEKEKVQVEKQKEKLIKIESKLKKEITSVEKNIKQKLEEYQQKEGKIKNLEKELSEREVKINKLIKEAESQANQEKEKTQKQLNKIFKKEKALLNEKKQAEQEFVVLRDEFVKKENDLLEKSKVLEDKEKELVGKISEMRQATIAEREKLISEKEKILQLETALLRKEEELKREREVLKAKELSEQELLKEKEARLKEEAERLEELAKAKPEPETIKPEVVETVIPDTEEKKENEVQEPKIEDKKEETVPEKKEEKIDEPESSPKEDKPQKQIVTSDSEKLLHLSVQRDLKQMFSSADYKDVRIIFVNIKKATFSDAVTFKNFMAKLIEKGHTNIIVDFTYCNYVDSTFLGAVLTTLKKIKTLEGSFKLVISDEVRSSLIMLTQADKLLSVYENLSDAYKN
ncbi:MAG: cyclic nucleotide-binding domain-containing protein [Rhodothermaceae bacterium]